MKVAKEQIHLSEFHPSLSVRLDPQSVAYAPLVISEDGTLIDGYRRFKLGQEKEVDVITVPSREIFRTALALNYRTRIWDDTDRFLWIRWARALNVNTGEMQMRPFPDKAFDAPPDFVEALANRELTFRQFILLVESPERYRSFFLRFLTEEIQLNANETGVFIEMTLDLIKLLKVSTANELFSQSVFDRILANSELNRKQKGERLLVEMRGLRYPYYTKKSKDFSSYWGQLGLEPFIQAKKSAFLERGTLEIALSAASIEEFREKVSLLYSSLESPLWAKIWES